MEYTQKMLENAQKVTYLISCYPSKPLQEIINFMQLPPIQINSAIWVAQDKGYISEPNEESGISESLSPPEPYEFGDIEEELEAMLTYCFGKMTKKEQDLEENYLNQWLMGYGSHDHIVAMKRLLNNGVLAEYTVDDAQLDEKGKQVYNKDKTPVVNEYTFYTLAGNEVHRWGEKNFKTEPKKPKFKK